MQKLNWKVTFIHCAGCERRIQTVLSHQSGVQAASASQRSQTVEVEYDEGRISPQQIKEAIEKAGFEVKSEVAA